MVKLHQHKWKKKMIKNIPSTHKDSRVGENTQHKRKFEQNENLSHFYMCELFCSFSFYGNLSVSIMCVWCEYLSVRIEASATTDECRHPKSALNKMQMWKCNKRKKLDQSVSRVFKTLLCMHTAHRHCCLTLIVVAAGFRSTQASTYKWMLCWFFFFGIDLCVPLFLCPKLQSA